MKEDLNTGIRRKREDAIYQYLIDHAKPVGNLYRISFFLKDKDDWERRVKYRMNGVARTDELALEQKMFNKNWGFLNQQKIANELGIRINMIDQSGSWTEKIILFLYRKCRNYIHAPRSTKHS